MRTALHLLQRIGAMDRQQLIHEIKDLHCTFRLDFTDEFLSSLSLGRLRHILLAASLHQTAPSQQLSA